MSIGSGEGATSLRADRFVLASRSDYFRACLDQRSFQEGAAGRVTLDVPSPQPSAAASQDKTEEEGGACRGVVASGCRASSSCLVACFILCIERRRNVVVPVKERRISESSVGVCWNRIPRRGP